MSAAPAPTIVANLRRRILASDLSKRELARRAGVRPELISRLASQEGCDTRTLERLADALGLAVTLVAKPPGGQSKALRLGLSLPYDWSNPDISDIALIRKVVEHANLADLTRIVLAFGIDIVEAEMHAMPESLTRSAAMVLPNIRAALAR